MLIDPGYARRPVTVTPGNKTLIRIEGRNIEAEWPRLCNLIGLMSQMRPALIRCQQRAA